MNVAIDWIWRLRWVTWIFVGTATLLAWRFVPPVTFDQSIEGFFPAGHAGLVTYHRARELFGSDDLAFVGYDDPDLWSEAGMERIRELRSQLQSIRVEVDDPSALAPGTKVDRPEGETSNGASAGGAPRGDAGPAMVPGVLRVESLDDMPIPWRIDNAVESIASGHFNLFAVMGSRATIGDAIRLASGNPEEMAHLRERVCEHTLFRGVLVNPEGTTTVLIVTMQNARAVDHKAVVRAIREMADAFGRKHGYEHVSVAGPPVLVSDGFVSLDRDNQTLGVIAMGLMALTMLIAVRNPGWALLPLVAGWATWQLVRTMLWLLDLELTLSSGPIVAQTVVLCMPAAAHLAMRFRELRTELQEPVAAARKTLADVATPVAWCAVTAAAGYFAAWATSDVQPVSQFGLTMAASNLAAGLLSYVLSAGAMGLSARFGRTPPPHELKRGAARLTPWIIRHPWAVVGGFVIPASIAAVGSAGLELESNYIHVFRSRSRIVSDYQRIEERLGGIGLFEVVLPAPPNPTPESLRELEATSREIRAFGPAVVSEVLSLDDVLLPENAGEISSDVLSRVIQFKVFLLRAPQFRYVLERLWNENEGVTRILIRIRESAPADKKQQFLDSLESWAKSREAQPTYVTGLSHLLTQITESIVTTSFHSAAWSAVLVFGMLLLALRSLWLAVLALFPTALAVGLVLGVMGWFGLKIDMTTALVSSVAIGLSVDDTFHCLLHWKQKLREGKSVDDALITSYAASGPGVILSSSAVSLGFLSSMASEFVPTANFGWLVAVATFGGSAGNLFILPAVLTLAGRRGRREA